LLSLLKLQFPFDFGMRLFLTACYLINRLPSKVIGNNTPLGRLLKTQPNYTLLCNFLCIC
jgi:hypothetical protein